MCVFALSSSDFSPGTSFFSTCVYVCVQSRGAGVFCSNAEHTTIQTNGGLTKKRQLNAADLDILSL